jgi:hypothetical protein
MSVPIHSRPLMILRLATSATQDIGSTPQGALTIFPVIGGSFEGERLRGKVLAGGGDWVTAHGDGTVTLDLRVTLETDDEGLIHMTFTGARRREPLLPHGAALRDRRAEVRVPQSSRCSRHRGDPP